MSTLSTTTLVGRYRGFSLSVGSKPLVIAGQRINLSEGLLVMTRSSHKVRVKLYGCSHTPAFTAFTHPIIGDVLLCYACNRTRTVVGVITGWDGSRMSCNRCPWSMVSERTPAVRMKRLAHVHANALGHTVRIYVDDRVIEVRPQNGYQPALFDLEAL